MNRDHLYLLHMRDATVKIERYSAVGRERFMEESHWQDAVIRQLEMIGEAAKRVSEQTRQLHPDVEWKRVAGLRDVLIHQYMGVDLNVVWELTQRRIPDLHRQLDDILQPSKPD